MSVNSSNLNLYPHSISKMASGYRAFKSTNCCSSGVYFDLAFPLFASVLAPGFLSLCEGVVGVSLAGANQFPAAPFFSEEEEEDEEVFL